MPQPRKFLGITVLPEFFQNETVDGVLDNLVSRAGVTAIATSPYVMEPADEATGSREPPDDAGAGNVRLLDRELWGRRELFVRTAPSFTPDKSLYAGLKYQPAEPKELSRRDGHIIRDAIRGAQARHIQVYLQVQSAIPPGYRVQFGGPDEADSPRLPDGRIPPRRVAKNGSLASQPIADYTRALLRDLCRAYPEVDAIRVDWPEYPPYVLDDVSLDVSQPARVAAAKWGFDFDTMQADCRAAYEHLHGKLTNADLAAWNEGDGGRYELLTYLARRPGVMELFRFKARLAEEYLRGLNAAVAEASSNRVELQAAAFPPPFSFASGMEFARLAPHCASFCMKLYTMHWAMMVNFYGMAIMAANPGLDEASLTRAIVRWFDMADDEGLSTLADYEYPEPDEPHPAGTAAQARKIRQAERAAGERPVYVLVHGYGAASDFRRRLRVAWETTSHGVWINRYGYLSDEKLSIVGQVCGTRT